MRVLYAYLARPETSRETVCIHAEGSNALARNQTSGYPMFDIRRHVCIILNTTAHIIHHSESRICISSLSTNFSTRFDIHVSPNIATHEPSTATRCRAEDRATLPGVIRRLAEGAAICASTRARTYNALRLWIPSTRLGVLARN